MPDDISIVKIFTQMMTEDQELFTRFINLYLIECEKYNERGFFDSEPEDTTIFL